MAACVGELNENNTYVVAIVRSDGDFSSEKEHIVVGNPLEQTVLCSEKECQCSFYKHGSADGNVMSIILLYHIFL